MNAHVLDVRVAALLTFYAALLAEAALRTPGGGTPIAVPAAVREETLQLAREVLATVPRQPSPAWREGPMTVNGRVAPSVVRSDPGLMA